MMMFTLPWPPSLNHYYRRVGQKTLISGKGRAYRKKVGSALFTTNRQVANGPLAIDIKAHPPDNRRRDVDNLLKALLDAMAHCGVYQDDSQIKRLSIEMVETRPDGLLIVEIAPL